MISFKAGGIEFNMDFSFFAVIGVVLAFDGSGYGGLYLAACFCHELAHLLAMVIEGKAPERMVFNGGGIGILSREEPSFFVLVAGCFVNFALFVIFAFILRQDSIYKPVFAFSNLCSGIFNLLPIGELDGKRIAEKLLSRLCSPYLSIRITSIAEKIICFIWSAAVLLLMYMGMFNLTAVFVMIYNFAVNFFENRF